jgi:alpha-beta hydrolase superfamily lysophospholipase
MSEPAPVVFAEQSGFFKAPDNLRLFWRTYIPYRPRAVIALVHGYADHSGRYKATLRHFAGLGYAMHAFDYRGHGQSDGRRGHVDHFSDYLGDYQAFLDRVRAESKDQKLFILAHSHGSLMSIRYALDHPELPDFGGAVLSGPYLKLAFAPPRAKVIAGQIIGTIIPWLPVKNELSSEMLTHDVEVQKATDRDPLYNRTTTPRWFNESNRTQLEVLARAAEFKWPSLFLHGREDPIASPEATKDFYERAGSTDKQLIVYEGLRHEVLNETEHERVWRDVAEWIEKRL